MMKQITEALTKRVPFMKKLIMVMTPKQGAFPAGHYYSPIPSKEEVLAWIKSRGTPPARLPGIDLNEKQQRDLSALSPAVRPK